MQKTLLNKIKSIKGVGNSSISDMRSLFGVNTKKRAEFNLSYNGVLRIKKFLRVKKTTVLLQTIIKKRINNQVAIKSYKGLRHKNRYPVRGQRTHTNAKTQRKLSLVN
jgi:small subunit ribosomal protein S13